MQNCKEFIFSDEPFEAKAIRIFKYQYEKNPVYRRFCEALDFTPDVIFSYAESVLNKKEKKAIPKSIQDEIKKIPLLPIQAFKDAEIFCKLDLKAELQFQSSGTGGMKRSVHSVADGELYRQSIIQGFNQFYDLNNAVILGYTPGYSENPHSSLIWMINELVKQDKIDKSRFLPLNRKLSQGEIDDIAASGKQLYLFGAAFGLMDLVEISSVNLPSDSIILETGGMKTYRRAIDRQKMHRALAEGFGIDNSRIHSEYGMCELLSQAYAMGGKWFRSVPWMRVSIHDPDDPQRRVAPHREGLIGVMDLANVHSCSFVLTGDRGLMDREGRFQVLGRWNSTDLRGCNFLIDED